jgi:DoxX-like family
MREHLSTIAVPGLRWALGLVVLLESVHFALSPAAARHFPQTGLPQWIRPALAWSEAVAAVLFLIPISTAAGGYALLLIFTFAIVIHLHAGDFSVGGLVVYAMAVVVCITHRENAYEHQR